MLRNLVAVHLVGNAAQLSFVLRRLKTFSLKHAGHTNVFDDRTCGEYLTRAGKPLHARCDVHRLSEIILPLV